MSECHINNTKLNDNDWFNNLVSFIKDEEVISKLIRLQKEDRITYIEHCGRESYFNNEGKKQPRDYMITTDKGSYIRPRRETEYNLCFQYMPSKRTIKGYEYITLKVDDE
jgi:hypothetical protein